MPSAINDNNTNEPAVPSTPAPTRDTIIEKKAAAPVAPAPSAPTAPGTVAAAKPDEAVTADESEPADAPLTDVVRPQPDENSATPLSPSEPEPDAETGETGPAEPDSGANSASPGPPPDADTTTTPAPEPTPAKTVTTTKSPDTSEPVSSPSPTKVVTPVRSKPDVVPAPDPASAVAPTPAACPSFLDQLRAYLAGLRAKALRTRREHMAANLEKIVVFAREHGRVTNNDVERLTGVKDTRATDYLNQLVQENKLRRYGTGGKTYYQPV